MPQLQIPGLRRPGFLKGVAVDTRINNASFLPGTIAPIRAHMPAIPDEPTEEDIAAKVAMASATEAKKLSAQFAERTGAAVALLRSTADRLAAEARTDALEIGFLVARRILEMELSTSPEPLVNLVRGAVRRLGESRHIIIHLSPEDATTLTQALQAQGNQAVSPVSVAQIDVVADGALKRGDCLVEGDQVTVDGRIDVRLEELHRILTTGAFEDPA
jgi:flagellar assembly protein FliH